MIPFDDVIAIIAIGYVVFGISGFGASLLTIPLLSHIYPVTFVLALAALLDMGSAFFIGLKERRHADVAEIKWLVPFSVIRAIASVTLLIHLPRELTLAALGTFIGG